MGLKFIEHALSRITELSAAGNHEDLRSAVEELGKYLQGIRDALSHAERKQLIHVIAQAQSTPMYGQQERNPISRLLP